MSTLRNPGSVNGDRAGTSRSTDAMSAYEQSREERIRENIETMQKLGIFDLSLKLKLSSNENRLRSRALKQKHRNGDQTPPDASPLLRLEPTRRSSRLKNETPVNYSEVETGKKNKVALYDGEDLLDNAGSKPEIYTDEHEKMLGNTEKSWTLFVDGYGADGKRIYDPVKGQTCHQCRQKTLGHHTSCIRCNKVQGQFCGDCLYMRYGEHVLEAMKNPEWLCPVCRGICNCSLCRTSKGWAPTGTLYKKVTKLGYKSVAHFLIQTRRSVANPETDHNAANKVSVKRSITFSDMEAGPPVQLSSLPKAAAKSDNIDNGARESEIKQEVLNGMEVNEEFLTVEMGSVKRSSAFLNIEKLEDKNIEIKEEVLNGMEVNEEFLTVETGSVKRSPTLNIQKPEDKNDNCNDALEFGKGVGKVEKESNDNENTPLLKSPKLKQKHAFDVALGEDTIGARLRQRRKKIEVEDKSA